MTCHGLRPGRPVKDLDILLNPTSEGVTRFNTFQKRYATIWGRVANSYETKIEILEPGAFLNLDETIPVDFRFLDSTQEFVDYDKRSVGLTVNGLGIRVMSLKDLQGMMLDTVDRQTKRTITQSQYLDSILQLLATTEAPKREGHPIALTKFIGPREAWLISFLNRLSVPYVLQTGAAFQYHGIRILRDEDMIVSVLLNPSMGAAKSFAEAMDAAAQQAGKLVATKFDPVRMSRPNVKFAPDLAEFNLGFLTAASRDLFSQVYASSKLAKLNLMNVRIASLAGLKLLMEAELAYGKARIDKAKTDLENLEPALKSS